MRLKGYKGWSREFVFAFNNLKQTVITLEEILIKHGLRPPQTCCVEPSAIQNDDMPPPMEEKIQGAWARVGVFRDVVAARFKIACQELELDVQFNAPFWDAVVGTAEDTFDESPTPPEPAEQPISPTLSRCWMIPIR